MQSKLALFWKFAFNGNRKRLLLQITTIKIRDFSEGSRLKKYDYPIV